MRYLEWSAVLAFVCGAIALAGCAKKSEGECLFPSAITISAEQALDTKLRDLGIEESPVSGLDSLEVTDEEKDALTFIYAYSSTADMLDHGLEFYLANIRTALRAREELPWGKSIPADQFRHFVLPLRVNNEILDNFRVEYYEELRNLVQGMTMEEAVLELNHWSHQHITYEPSDGRTSSPLATLRNALGRCGEQSTFVAAVLRTVGIPARQVYTPRWAHTDSNHAWVEAWVDGEWHYIGASEPAPVLDNAWFDAPVLRAMMLHTRAFGPYRGSEEWLGENATSTELNVSSNYIPTAVARVKVVNAAGEPQEGVKVTFRIYNYTELYPIVTRTTNGLGEASVQLGLGDVMVVAGRSPQEMAVGQLSVKEGGSELVLTLGDYESMPEELHFRIVPPVEQVPQIDITPEQEAENNRRMGENNAIRTAYTDTFPTEEDGKELASALGLQGATAEQLTDLLVKSRGYHETITAFLRMAGEKGQAEEAVTILSTLREKDMHDVNPMVLEQALVRTESMSPEQWKNPNIIGPRVMLEHLYPAEPALEAAISNLASSIGVEWEELSATNKAAALTKMVGSFHLDETYNPRQIVLNPATVLKYQMGDAKSLTVTLVRLLRTANIPAAYDAANSVVVYWDEEGKQHILPFLQEDSSEEITADCELRLTYTPAGYLKTPRYRANYTLGYVGNDGQLNMYGFDFGAPFNELIGEKLVYHDNFTSTGTRLADGTVLLRMRKVACGESAELVFDQDEQQLSVIGSLDAEMLYADKASGTEKSILSTTGRGYYLLVLGLPHHEPTDHILRDMKVLVGNDGKLPLPTLVLTPGSGTLPDELVALLPEATWGQDTKGMEEALISGAELPSRLNKPVVVVADTFNRVVFISQGYTIGIGERLAAVIEELK